MEKKSLKIKSAIAVAAVFVALIAASAGIIYLSKSFEKPKELDLQALTAEEAYCNEEAELLIGRNADYIGEIFGAPTSRDDKATNGKPGDMTVYYSTGIVNFSKSEGDDLKSVWVQTWNDNSLLPRGIKIGDSYEKIRAKYPENEAVDEEFKPYDDEAQSLQYKTIYGEYKVSESYAIGVWDMNNPDKTYPIRLIYATADTGITYYLEGGKLVVAEYTGK